VEHLGRSTGPLLCPRAATAPLPERPFGGHCARLEGRAPRWARSTTMPDGNGYPRVGSHAPHPTGWGPRRSRGGASRPAAAPATPKGASQWRQPHQRCYLVLVAGDPGGHVQTNLATPASSTPHATAVCTIHRPHADCAGVTASGAMSLMLTCGSECLSTGRRGLFAPHLCHAKPGAGSVGPLTRPPHAPFLQSGARTPSISPPTRAATLAMPLVGGRARGDNDGGNSAW